MSKMYLLSYSQGEYSDRSTTNVALFWKKEDAQTLCKKFEEIEKFLYDMQLRCNKFESEQKLQWEKQKDSLKFLAAEWLENEKKWSAFITPLKEGFINRELATMDDKLKPYLNSYPIAIQYHFGRTRFDVEDIDIWDAMA